MRRYVGLCRLQAGLCETASREGWRCGWKCRQKLVGEGLTNVVNDWEATRHRPIWQMPDEELELVLRTA